MKIALFVLNAKKTQSIQENIIITKSNSYMITTKKNCKYSCVDT